MASIPCSSRHSVSYVKDVQHLLRKQAQNSRLSFASQPPPTTGLQYFNMRVTQRLHRYRSLKKQWQEVAASVQNTSLSPTCESPILQDTAKNLAILTQKPVGEPKTYFINDYINVTASLKDNNEKNGVELDPLHSRIQQDLISLRKFIKSKQRKSGDRASLKTSTSSKPSGEVTSANTALDDQENHNITINKKASVSNKLKPLDRVKIAGCQMRRPIFPKADSSDSGGGSSSNPSSTCSQYSKQQKQQQQQLQQQQQQQKSKRHNNTKIFNIYHSRVNPGQPLPTDTFLCRASYTSKRKSNTSSRMSQYISSKQLIPSHLSTPIPPIIEQKQPSFTKQETPLPPLQRSATSSDLTSRFYTYAAPSSSATPRSMMLKRNTSLLPILLQSCSCIGIQSREIHPKKIESDLEEEQEEEEENNDDDDYYHLLDYNHLINRLPKPLISIFPRYGQDDYGILFEQLDHIRETMPDSNIYDDYVRI